MPDIRTIKTALHRIDLKQEAIGDSIPVGEDTDFDTYVGRLMDDMYKSSRYKSYKFSSTETEIARQAMLVDQDSWVSRSKVVADRLLRVEKATQERIQHIVDLRMGSLVQILAEVDGQKNFVITKVDHSAYLDEHSLKEQLGLPVNQRVQKTAIVTFEDDTTVSSIRLSDTNNKISQYWWKDFLEVEELKSSEKNTSLAFNSIDKVLRKSVRNVSKSDFWTLRNAVVSYFRTSESCTFDILVQSIFDGYSPDNQAVNMASVKEKIAALPEKHDFDSQFEIDSKSIKAKIKDQIKLAENLELKFTGEIDDLPNLIDTGESDDGRKFIRIYSEAGYAEFNKQLEPIECI